MNKVKLDNRGVPLKFKFICILCGRKKLRDDESKTVWLICSEKNEDNMYLALCSSHRDYRRDIVIGFRHRRRMNMQFKKYIKDLMQSILQKYKFNPNVQKYILCW